MLTRGEKQMKSFNKPSFNQDTAIWLLNHITEIAEQMAPEKREEYKRTHAVQFFARIVKAKFLGTFINSSKLRPIMSEDLRNLIVIYNNNFSKNTYQGPLDALEDAV